VISDDDSITLTITGSAAAELRRVAKVAVLSTERAVTTMAAIAMLRGLPSVEEDLRANNKPKRPYVRKRARKSADDDSQRAADVVSREILDPGRCPQHESEDSSPHLSDEERAP
jgi:hypothetical protein